MSVAKTFAFERRTSELARLALALPIRVKRVYSRAVLDRNASRIRRVRAKLPKGKRR